MAATAVFGDAGATAILIVVVLYSMKLTNCRVKNIAKLDDPATLSFI